VVLEGQVLEGQVLEVRNNHLASGCEKWVVINPSVFLPTQSEGTVIESDRL
jgi:hypothetical protein